jgi:outer membrane protein
MTPGVSAIAFAALGLCAGAALMDAQPALDSPRDYTRAVPAFPSILRPYRTRTVSEPDLAGGDLSSMIRDGKLRLSMADVVAAVVRNNLSIAAARFYPSIAQTDLLRARSGNSPRGVDAAQIPSGVFAGAVGGSILGTAGASGSGSSNPGGITGSAGRVSLRPAGLFDPSLGVNFSLDHTTSPLNSLVVAGVPSVTTTTAAFSVNYVQAFASGTSFNVSYGIQRQASTQLHLLFNPTFTPGFTASVTQQVLKGFGYAVNRTLIKVAENEQQIERDSFRQQAITALAAAQSAYWDLAATQAGVRSAQQALEAAQQLERESRIQLRTGTMAPLDVVTAQAQVAAAKRDLVVAQTAVQNTELQLKSMISKNLDEPLASASIEVADAFPDPAGATAPALQDALETAKQNRPELAIAAGNIKSDLDALPFIRNSLLPDFNVFGLVTTVGLYNIFGTSFTDVIHFRYPEYAVGVSLSFPLHNRQAQADDIRSRLELRQAKDTLVRSQTQVEVDVQNALIAVKQAAAQVTAANAALGLERDKLDAEQKKLQAGLSTSYNVILVQRDLLAAELAYVQARDTYAKALVSLDQAEGVTLEKNHLNLDALIRGK